MSTSTGQSSSRLADEAPATLPALLARLAAQRSEHPAVLTEAESLSYRELDERSAKLAIALLAAGAGKGTRLGLLAPDGILWVTAFLAGLRIGALVTAISTLATPAELAHILRHADVQMLIGARRFLSHDYAEKLATALPDLMTCKPCRLRSRDAPYLRAVWLDDPDGYPFAQSIRELLALAEVPDAPSRSLLRAVESEVAPSDDAVVVFTSGSTALPKAVMHTQWTVARHPPELARNFVLTPNDRMMPLLPAFWLAGMSMLLQVLSVGATLVYPNAPDDDAALRAIERFKVNRVNAWGDRQPRLIAAAQARGVDLRHIPDLSCFRDSSGRPLPPKIAMYGMTESFSAHSAEPLDRPLPPDKAASFGRAINGYERRVVDPQTGIEVASGEVGELQIRGPALMSGMYKLERSKVFTRDGFYPTRDLVRIDADGWLYPVGRLDDMIKTRGANVSRLEVEAALLALPEVKAAVVAGLPDPELGRRVVAGVVLQEGVSSSETELQAALRQTLSSYKVPRRIVFIREDDIPRTATGKVKLADVATMIADRLQGGATQAQERGPS